MSRLKSTGKWWLTPDLAIGHARELLGESGMFGDCAPLSEADRIECTAALADRFGSGWLADLERGAPEGNKNALTKIKGVNLPICFPPQSEADHEHN